MLRSAATFRRSTSATGTLLGSTVARGAANSESVSAFVAQRAATGGDQWHLSSESA